MGINIESSTKVSIIYFKGLNELCDKIAKKIIKNNKAFMRRLNKDLKKLK
ncbi:hypothetical protein LCGC14_1891310 [marine sediment metagenome]|uniref:Uncharacterized protein n=1 Tax=marine sediment metagenome TaxID=412755 RepID=A0A0F9GMP1_9ZZZZ